MSLLEVLKSNVSKFGFGQWIKNLFNVLFKEHLSTTRDIFIILAIIAIACKDILPGIWTLSDEHNAKIFVKKQDWQNWADKNELDDKEFKKDIMEGVQIMDRKLTVINNKMDDGFGKINGRIDQLFIMLFNDKNKSSVSMTSLTNQIVSAKTKGL